MYVESGRRSLLSPAPLSSLDTLPRLPSPLNQNGEILIEVYNFQKSHGKRGDCEQSNKWSNFGLLIAISYKTLTKPLLSIKSPTLGFFKVTLNLVCT